MYYCKGLRVVGSRGLGVGSYIPHHILPYRPPYVLAHKVVLEGVGLPLGLGAAVVYT